MSAPVPARARSARQPLRLRRRRRSSLLLCATVWALGPGARVVLAQQPITPRIMVVFDTSSSMAWRVDSHQPAHGDGSFEFPTEAAVSCRLFEAKEALRDMLLSVGSAEARFGLARYHQEQGPQINPFPAEYPAPINYRGDCAGGDILVPFAADNLPALLSWIDQQEDFPDDPELRADGPTPLASTLLGVRDHFREHVLPDDELRDCRQHAIILLTDAQDTCGGNPVAAIRELRAITLADGSGPYRVSAFVIGFGRLGNEGEQALNALAIAAGTAVNGRAYRAQDRLALQVALGQIIGRALPHEICDGQDNDCDGEADEGVVNACGFCGPLPEEICDGLDNDCDGETDEGMRNACGECGPDREELLNGIDDDCDGTIDEGFGRIWQPEVCDGLDNDLDGETDEEVVRPCGSEPGICQPGVERCLGGRWSGVCEGELGPRPEECNGLDDDCDGSVDGITRTCGREEGECRPGVQRCHAGEWEDVCLGAVPSRPESCDGRDNDCDGETDEGVRNACGTCGAVPEELCNDRDEDCDGHVDEGAACPQGYFCARGGCTVECYFGECPGSRRCVEGICVLVPCDVIHCPPGWVCDPARLEPGCHDPCAEIQCPAANGERRVCRLGRCEPPSCYEDGCMPGMVCRQGRCELDPCRPGLCPPDQACRDGQCVPSCAGVSCPDGQQCQEGSCAPLTCRGEVCPPGQVCLGGRCGPDPCAGVVCPHGTACRDGACTDPPCRFVHCPRGQRCAGGSCFTEEPPLEDGGPPAVDAGPSDLPEVGVDGGSLDGGGRGAADDDDDGGEDGGCSCVLRHGSEPASGGLTLAVVVVLLGLPAGEVLRRGRRRERGPR